MDSLTDSRRFMAWAGSTADLLPILQAMERQFADARLTHVSEKTSFYRSEVARKQEDFERAKAFYARTGGDDASAAPEDSTTRMYRQFYDESMERLREVEEEAEKFDEISVELRSKRGGATRRTRGRPMQILDYLTHLDVQELELIAPAGYGLRDRVSVHFDDDGVRVVASSADSRWTSAAIAQVTEAVRRRVPWWRWMRSLWFLIPLIAVTVTFLTFSAASAVPADAIDKSVLSVLTVVATWTLTPLSVWAATKALPPFELSAAERPRGTRVFYVLGSTALSFIVGILVNAVS